MKATLAIVVTLVATTSLVHADKKKPALTVADQVNERLPEILVHVDDTRPIKFAFNLQDPAIDPAKGTDFNDYELGFWVIKGKMAAIVSADGKSVFYSADLGWADPCGDETCPRVPKPDGYYHVTALLDGAAPWRATTWHIANTVTSKDQSMMMDIGGAPKAIPRRIEKGAEPVVAVFEASIGDPKALAKTVSRRAALLYGSELKERYVGGAKVAATLAKWNLGFKVRDGIQAGLSPAGTSAWVAANLDATSMKKKGAKPTPYRALFLYEQADGAWQLVSAHFSFNVD